MPLLTLLTLTFTLGYAAFQQGGVWPNEFNICLVSVGLLTVVHFVWRARDTTVSMSRTSRILLAIFFICGCLQLVPLPFSWLHLFSPTRAELLSAMSQVGGVPV
jgi:hypothetical protein